VQAAGESSYPQFRFVVVAYAGQDPVLATTVNDGLAQLFGQPPAQPLPDGGAAPTTPSPPAGGNVQDLLNQAADTYSQAQAALRQGDLGTYQQLINQVGDLLNQARQAAGGGGGTGGTGATTTTTTPARQTAAGAGAAEP